MPPVVGAIKSVGRWSSESYLLYLRHRTPSLVILVPLACLALREPRYANFSALLLLYGCLTLRLSRHSDSEGSLVHLDLSFFDQKAPCLKLFPSPSQSES